MGLDTRGRVSSPVWSPPARPTFCSISDCFLNEGAQRGPPTMVILAWTGRRHHRPRPPPYAHGVPDGRNHNGEGGGGGTEGGGGHRDGTDEEELGAFWEFLDNELRPIQPMQSCPESLSIFSQHKEMARKYLILQQEIFNLRKSKSTLEEKLSQAEKLEQIGNQRYQDKIRELENKRENLRHTHSRLRQQLEQIRLRQEEQQQRQNQQDDGNDIGIGHNHHISPP